MKIRVSDGLTFNYLFNVTEGITVSEFTPILGSYLGLKSKEELEFIRLSTLQETPSANPWAVDVDYIKAHALKGNERFDSFPVLTLNGESAVHILVSGVTRRQISEEVSPPGMRTPSESYDLHSPTKDEDYDLFRPAVLIYALAMKAGHREMIKVNTLLKKNLSREDVSLDLDKSFGIASALSLSNFQGFIKSLFPDVNLEHLTKAWGLNNKKFVTVKDLENILQICDFPLMHASFQGAVRMAFMLTNVPFTKSFPISGSLKTQYVVATVEPLLNMMLEFAIRSGLNGGYMGVSADFLPRGQAEEMLRRSGPGSFLTRISGAKLVDLAVSYIPVPKNESTLDDPFVDLVHRVTPAVGRGEEVIHEILQLSASVNGYVLRGVEYPSPAAALIANSSFLQNPCMKGALATKGFGSQIGIAAQRQSSCPPFVLLDMAMRHGFANTDPLDENLLKIMKDYVLDDLGLDALGNRTRPTGDKLLFQGFFPEGAFAGPSPVNWVISEYCIDVSSSLKFTPRRYGFMGFHGALTDEQAAERLLGNPKGCYLIRAAQQERGSAVLAFVDGSGKVQQTMISPAPSGRGNVVSSGSLYPSLHALIIAKSLQPSSGADALLKFAVAPYFEKPWKSKGINLITFSQQSHAMSVIEDSDTLYSDVLFPPVVSPAAPVEGASASMAVSDSLDGDPMEVATVLPSLSRRADNRPLTGWSPLDPTRLAETVWKSVVESPLDSYGVALCAENAIVLPKDIALAMSQEEILTLLDEPSKFEQLIAFSFLLQRLTHQLTVELDKVRYNLSKLPKPMQEKLIAYAGQTRFFINSPVLGVIRETLVVAEVVVPVGGELASPSAPADTEQVDVVPVQVLLPRGISPGFFSASPSVGISRLPEATGVTPALQASVLQRLSLAITMAGLANSSTAAANAAAAAANANAATVIREVSALLLEMSPEQAATAAPLLVAAGAGQEPSSTGISLTGAELLDNQLQLSRGA